MGEYFAVGKNLPRVDGIAKAAGWAKYSPDIILPGMLYGKILRSHHHHAKILNINTSKAKSLPGVRAIVTAEDTPKIECSPWAIGKYILATDKVRCIGDEVAAVAAIDEDIAKEALELIKVEYEPLSAVLDPLEAMKPGAPLIHDVENNIAEIFNIERGDVDSGFKEADYIVEDRFETQLQNHCYMEPLTCVADFDPSGKLTIWLASMDMYNVRKGLAKVLNMTESKVRVIQSYVGGAFGARMDIEPIQAICALLAKKTGRAVKMANTREEQFMASFRRLNASFDQKLGVRRDGKIVAKKIKITADAGAYSTWVTGLQMKRIATCADTMYEVPYAKVDAKLVYTNKPYVTAFRGFGSIQGCFAMESQLDAIAKEMGMDPMELRLRNATKTGYKSIHGQVISSCGLSECIKKVADSVGWKEKKSKRSPQRGIGMACSMYVSDWRITPGFNGSVIFTEILEDGKVKIISGEHEYGQGMYNVLAQITAEELKIPIEDIQVTAQDTDITPYALGPYGGGRATISAGAAAKLAAEDARKQLFAKASEMLEANVEDLDIGEGKIYVKGSPEKGISIAEAATASIYGRGGSAIIGKGIDERDTEPMDFGTMMGNFSSAWTFSAHVAEVELDTETGQVRVLNYVAANDVGKAISPMNTEGQVEGQVAMGMGYGLMEDMIYQSGSMVATNFLDYKLPTATDVPPVKTILVESIEPHGPYGAKGVGRLAIIPVPAAIANAIYDATGIRFKSLPITPERILKGLEEKASFYE